MILHLSKEASPDALFSWPLLLPPLPFLPDTDLATRRMVPGARGVGTGRAEPAWSPSGLGEQEGGPQQAEVRGRGTFWDINV